MNVTIVADVLGKENNGTTIACMNLVRYLKSQGDTVKIVCCDKDKQGSENYYIVPTLNLGRTLNNYIKKNGVSIAWPKETIIQQALKDCDVVHIMTPFMLSRKTLKVARRRNIPVTAGFHCQAENFTSHLNLMNNRFANKLVYKNFYKDFYQYVDAIHYPTKFIKDVFEHAVNHQTNGYVISNGVHDRYKKIIARKPKSLKDKFVILFIGRYSKEKSHKILLDAVSKCKYKDNIQLIFAGDGPLKEKIIKKAKKLNINTPIMKFYSREELIKVINYSDLYCHPAEVEIEAIACLEAINCGLVPVISNSPKCATKHFALNENNLFKCNDSDDLALKIQYWIEHEDEKNSCSNSYLGYTKQFSQELCMKQMREMLLNTIKEKNEKKDNIL